MLPTELDHLFSIGEKSKEAVKISFGFLLFLLLRGETKV